MPKSPSAAISFVSSRGRMPCSNHSPTSGTIRSRTNWRTVSRIARSSSSSSASIARKSRGSSSVGFAVVAMTRIVEECYSRCSHVRERKPEPCGRVAPPKRLGMAPGVQAENMRDSRLRELLVQKLVLRLEPRVVGADVEGDQGGQTAELTALGACLAVHVGRSVPGCRAEIERSCPGRVGGVEVPAPRLDDGEVSQISQREVHRAVPAGRNADQRASVARGDRPEP